MGSGIHIPSSFSPEEANRLRALANAVQNPNSGPRFIATGGGNLAQKLNVPDFHTLLEEKLHEALENPA